MLMWLRLLGQLSIGMVILISAGIAGFYWLFKYDNGKDIKESIAELEKNKVEVQEKLDSLALELKKLQELDKAMNLMTGEINKFLQFIPNKLTSSMILRHLTVQAKSAGVRLEDITHHSSSEKEEFYEKIKTNVKVKGMFTQILVFLSKMTSLTEIITVDSFDIKEQAVAGKIGTGLSEVEMSMDIYGYRYTSPIVSDKIASAKNK